MRIRGLLLPAALEARISDGTWMRSAPGPELDGTSSWSAWNWCFYDLDQIAFETETVVAIGESEYPGFELLDADHLLCIADRGRDWPICLLYGDSERTDIVVGFDGYGGKWDELSPSFEIFLAKLVELPVVNDEAEAERRFPRGTVYITESGKRWRVGPSEDGVF